MTRGSLGNSRALRRRRGFVSLKVWIGFCGIIGLVVCTAADFNGLDLRRVVARIEKWTEWITLEPYERGVGGKWLLKDGMESRLPIVEVDAIPPHQ